MKQMIFSRGAILLVVALLVSCGGGNTKPVADDDEDATVETKNGEKESADDGRLTFLGISLGETASAMKEKLEQKGFTSELVSKDGKYYTFKGKVDGVPSSVDYFADDAGKITMFRYCDKKEYALDEAKARFKKLCDRYEARYGEGRHRETGVNTIIDEYVISTSKGDVCIRLEKQEYRPQNQYSVYVQF